MAQRNMRSLSPDSAIGSVYRNAAHFQHLVDKAAQVPPVAGDLPLFVLQLVSERLATTNPSRSFRHIGSERRAYGGPRGATGTAVCTQLATLRPGGVGWLRSCLGAPAQRLAPVAAQITRAARCS